MRRDGNGIGYGHGHDMGTIVMTGASFNARPSPETVENNSQNEMKMIKEG